ncbi:MAG: histone deacetylase family protein [Gammaproteobacteria bacterium]|jgi:acetoin utilization deacetylase AcuC-like enzyme|nr:histone deacetylase family protein [Gammaproteobacteria bacterium]MBT5202683.1 histone deacetylase family protein [Gammaproteobacteria bacterium]MBT5603295.1 histone deacetylase family protein [Gammaproteobacteria bacterium]MBT6244611.1 histone deacetylase family protein [Gammaproteobacteria bacterium]
MFKILTHKACLQHQLADHPERPARLHAVLDRLRSDGIITGTEDVISPVTAELLCLVHPAHFVEQVIAAEPETGTIRLDADTYLSNGSIKAAFMAAAANIQATQLVLENAAERVFCAVRPPGHHAERAEAMGFCLFNNIALAAETALQHPSINRIAILDFDVHHCNGTVDIFKDRPEVLVCSSFQEEFYPYRYMAFSNEHIVSVPLASGTKSQHFRRAIESQWVPAIEKHKPDFIFVSAGFDAHADDPLGGLLLSRDDYRWITELIIDLAKQYAKGRIVSTLEGGYNTEALADCAAEHASALQSYATIKS